MVSMYFLSGVQSDSNRFRRLTRRNCLCFCAAAADGSVAAGGCAGRTAPAGFELVGPQIAPPRGAVAEEHRPIHRSISGSDDGSTGDSSLLRRLPFERILQSGEESPENQGFSGASLVTFCAGRKLPAQERGISPPLRPQAPPAERQQLPYCPRACRLATDFSFQAPERKRGRVMQMLRPQLKGTHFQTRLKPMSVNQNMQ